MVAGAQQQHPPTSQSQHQQPQNQPQQQHQQQQLPTATLSSAQDEALKRNTDCVYFLASPLTCKKGSECEYRHSEYARVNPRDCWYWLNGNCLNPKCSFRHPPLDSFIGTPGTPTAAGQSVPLPQIVASSATHAPYNSSKQAVPCIFFQKGLCLKGDRCAFLHGPSPSTTNNKVSQVPVTSQGTEPPSPSIKKAFGGLEKCKQETKIPQANVAKLVEGSEAKPAPKVETQSNKNVVGMAMHVPLPPSSTGFKNEGSRFKVASTPPVTNGTSVPRSHRVRQAHVLDDHSLHSGKDGDEFLRESSPGFDVLVADELRNSDYYHEEDASNLDSVNEYDLGHPDYNPIADIDQERFRVQQGYDLYDHMQESYAREQHRSSSERIYGASAHSERRMHRRSNSPENVGVSDLRHHLSKRRRVSGLKSVVSHDYSPESHGEEQGHWFPRKELHQLPLNESSLSNRLRGRIKLPANGGDNHLEREADRGRNRSRLSPGRLQIPHQGRLRDRLRGSVHDDYERKNFWGRPMRREIIGNSSTDFSGPKSLAELKVGKNTDNKEEQSLGKRKSSRDHRQYDDDLLFDGPKPLSEILKEKRGTGAEASSQSVKLPDNRRDIKDSEAATGSENNTATTEAQNGALAATKQDVPINEGESKSSEVGIDIDKTNTAHGQLSADGIIYDETMEDQEYEGDDNQREGDYDYEQGDEGDYNYDEGENAEQDEYIDDEDGDDFAKKIGVVLS